MKVGNTRTGNQGKPRPYDTMLRKRPNQTHWGPAGRGSGEKMVPDGLGYVNAVGWGVCMCLCVHMHV